MEDVLDDLDKIMTQMLKHIGSGPFSKTDEEAYAIETAATVMERLVKNEMREFDSKILIKATLKPIITLLIAKLPTLQTTALSWHGLS